MPGKRLNPDQTITAITLREAGYSIVSVASRLNVSVSTLQRLYRKHETKAGSLSTEAIKRATEELAEHITNTDQIKKEAAKLVHDDLSHARLIREKAALTLESLTAKDTADAALTMRALAAYSTLLSNTGQLIRRGMRLDRDGLFEDIESLPVLPIVEMTAEDVERIQRESARLGLGMDDGDLLDGEVTTEDDEIVVIGG